MKKLFLAKEKKEDRDAFIYIEELSEVLECGHYFPMLRLHGACWSGCTMPEYSEVITCLSKEEWEELIKYNEKISNLGYGIKEGSEKRAQGIESIKKIKYIFNKLKEKKNNILFNMLLKKDWFIFKNENKLNDEEIEEIKNNYCGDFQDSSIVSYIYNSIYEYGKEEFEHFYNVDENIKSYIDFETFGEDLARENGCMLPDGRVVIYNC